MKRYHKYTASVFKTIVILAIEIAVGYVFHRMGMKEVHIFTVYVLGILITAMVTASRLCSILSVGGIFTFYYLFSAPTFSFRSYGFGYPLTFVLLLISAIMVGTLAKKNVQHTVELEKTAGRNQILLETNQRLQGAKCQQDITEVTAERLIKILNRNVLIFAGNEKELTEPQIFFTEGGGSLSFSLNQQEQDAALWSYLHQKMAGAMAEIYGYVRGTYIPIYTKEGNYGVIGIDFKDQKAIPYEVPLIIGECALAFEREYYSRAREAAAVQAKDEKLRADLLRSISHDLRTPLTSILGNAALLSKQGELLAPEKRSVLSEDILKDATWLIHMVENLLSITKLGDMKQNIVMRPELLQDILEDALEHAKTSDANHSYRLIVHDELEIVLCNAQLISQVMTNLLENAAKFSGKQTTITVRTMSREDMVLVQVEDEGRGVEKRDREHIFDMFYTTSQTNVDQGRGFGIGLALCRAIIHQHEGDITVSDHLPKGAVFTFTLKRERMEF